MRYYVLLLVIARGHKVRCEPLDVVWRRVLDRVGEKNYVPLDTVQILGNVVGQGRLVCHSLVSVN